MQNTVAKASAAGHSSKGVGVVAAAIVCSVLIGFVGAGAPSPPQDIVELPRTSSASVSSINLSRASEVVVPDEAQSEQSAAPAAQAKSDLVSLSPTGHSYSAAPPQQSDNNYSYVKGQKLKVLNLNAWGLSWPFSQDRDQRFKALREIIAYSDYDIVLLQEVWYRSDHRVIRNAMPFVTYYDSFNTGCNGRLLPIDCSGLVILSRHPIEQVEFVPFTFRGSFWNFDGEIFVEKGVGRARVRWKNLSVDVFTSHLVSYTNNPNSDNTYFRYVQSIETNKAFTQSDADIKIFGGDINALPLMGPRQPYGILRSSGMRDALLDKYPDASFHPWFATFDNMRNSYSHGPKRCPERIDILLFQARDGIDMRTADFVMPMFMTRNSEGRLISLSDHEALHAEFTVVAPRNERPPPHITAKSGNAAAAGDAGFALDNHIDAAADAKNRTAGAAASGSESDTTTTTTAAASSHRVEQSHTRTRGYGVI